MPKPEEEKKEEEKTSEIEETKEGGVAVSLKDEEKTPETVVQEEKEEEKKEKVSQPKKQEIFYALRNLPKIEQEIAILREQLQNISSSTTTATAEQKVELDELDRLAQTDWKAAVGKIAELKTQELLKNQQEQIRQGQTQQQESQLMENNSQLVLERHPELEDATSEKSQIFQDILNKNSRWRTLPDGPLLTMYEMENELRKRGYDVDGTIKEKVEQEKERVTRAIGASLPSSRTTVASTNKIILTREQKEFCDQNGVSYEDYARTLKKSGEKGGIEI